VTVRCPSRFPPRSISGASATLEKPATLRRQIQRAESRLYPEAVAKVLAPVKHRLARTGRYGWEILEVLNPQPGEIALDGTLGYGATRASYCQNCSPADG